MQWLPRSASESVFPSMIDTYFERHSPLTCVSFAPVTYVQTRHTSMFKGSLFGSLTTMYMRANSLRIPSPLRSPGASYSSSRSSAFSPCSSCRCVSATRNSCSFTHPSRPSGEPEVGQSWFFYKDKGSALLAHKLILAECGPSRTWVIIQEVTKVLKENEATSLLHSVQGSNYARHYKRRMGDVRGSRAGDIRACDCVADRRCLSDSEVLSSIHT